MFIDYAILILGGLVTFAYVALNLLIVFHYSIRFMWNEFWVEQKWFGKICANVFYLPAWIISFVLVALVCLLNVVIVPTYKLFKWLANIVNPIFNKAIKLEM